MNKYFFFIFFLLFFDFFVFSCSIQQVFSLVDIPIIIGHRGIPSYRLEETSESYQLATQIGVDYIELDLCSTKDHVLILRHDCELSTTTNIDTIKEYQSRKKYSDYYFEEGKEGYFTEDFTLEEIKKLKTKERIPIIREENDIWNGLSSILTLTEFLQLHRALMQDQMNVLHQNSFIQCGKKARFSRDSYIGVYIETKHPSYFRSIGLPLEEKLADELINFGFSSQCSLLRNQVNATRYTECGIYLQSFEGNLRRLKDLLPDIPLIQLIGDEDEIQADSGVFYSELLTEEGLKELSTFAIGIGPSKTLIQPYSSGDHSLQKPTNLVQSAHDHKLLVHPYTFRSEDHFLYPLYNNNSYYEYQNMFELGIDGLFTDTGDDAIFARNIYYNCIRKVVSYDSFQESSSDDGFFDFEISVYDIVIILILTIDVILIIGFIIHKKTSLLDPITNKISFLKKSQNDDEENLDDNNERDYSVNES